MALEPVKDDDPTIGRLVLQAQEDISLLVRKEIELAKSELKITAKFGVLGVVFFAVAGFLALLAIIALTVALGFLIDRIPHIGPDGAFGIVTLLYLLTAGLLGLIGYKKFMAKVGPPEATIRQGKEIPKAFKGSK
ncbi:phage holin family protein [Nocardioides acrostichi]|uniref:Phage holin family protein n=1 Tax=Nocardioides acrostichi TaxID=2784339 RepID=A0A930V3C0_9ACTN|nr:phage holin family protein [Nocardioides acrostichi]MBF4163229.1 phage holin family protein [Nocardioides acrostichi]